jgi:flagellar motor component MotA
MKGIAGAIVGFGLVVLGMNMGGGDGSQLVGVATKSANDMTSGAASALEQNGPEISRGVSALSEAFRSGAAELGATLPTTTTTPVQP